MMCSCCTDERATCAGESQPYVSVVISQMESENEHEND